MGGVSSIHVTQSELLLLLVWEALHELNFCRHHVKPSMIFWMVVADGVDPLNACMTNWESPSTYHYVLQTQIPCKEDFFPSLWLLWLLLLELSRETLVFYSWLPSSCNFPFSILLMMQRRLCCIGLQLSSMLRCTLCCTQLYPALMMRCTLCCTWWQPVLMTSACSQLNTQLLLRKACTFNRAPVIPQGPGCDSEDFSSNGPPIFLKWEMLTSTVRYLLTFPFLCFIKKKKKKVVRKITKRNKEKLSKAEKVTQKVIQKCVINKHHTMPVNTTLF